jgi:hypothetical protein
VIEEPEDDYEEIYPEKEYIEEDYQDRMNYFDNIQIRRSP